MEKNYETEKLLTTEPPNETHNKWLKIKTAALCDALGAVNLVTAALHVRRIVQIEEAVHQVHSIAQQVGGTITPESLHQLEQWAESSTQLPKTGTVLAMVAAVGFFSTGLLLTEMAKSEK